MDGTPCHVMLTFTVSRLPEEAADLRQWSAGLPDSGRGRWRRGGVGVDVKEGMEDGGVWQVENRTEGNTGVLQPRLGLAPSPVGPHWSVSTLLPSS